MGRREREWQWRRREILDVALRLFSQKGYAGVSMQEIAKAAEFAVGTLYKFFPTKLDLYRELVLEKAKEIHDRVASAFEGDLNEIELLKRIAELKLEVVKEQRDFLRLYYSELWETRFSLRGTLADEVKALYGKYFERLVGIFRKGIERGVFKRKNPKLYALAFEGMLNNLLFALLEDESFSFSPDGVMEIFLDSILLERS